MRPTVTAYPCIEPHFMSAGKSRVIGIEEEVMREVFAGIPCVTRPTPALFANRLPARQHHIFPPTVLTVTPEYLEPKIVLTNPSTYVKLFYDEREGLTRVQVFDKRQN